MDELRQVLFRLGNNEFTLGSVILMGFLTLVTLYIYRYIKKSLFTKYLSAKGIEPKEFKVFNQYLRTLFLLLWGLISIHIFGLNHSFFTTDSVNVNVSLIFSGLFILNAARIIDWFITNYLVHNYYTIQDIESGRQTVLTTEAKMGKRVQYIIYIFALFLILRNFNLDPTLFHTQYGDNSFDFKLSNILLAVMVMLFARVIVDLLTQLIMVGVYQTRNIEVGAQIALNQIIKYVIFVISTIIALNYLGFNMTLIWGGAAALLVGLGLGLQQTFNDVFSGILLLFERTVTVGDILKLEDSTVGTVQRIGLRTTLFETRRNISLIVPNSKLVTNNVENLTHHNNKIRYSIDVGVAYGSDTSIVKSLLLKTVKNNPYVMEYPAPFVRFNNFGDSSLDFELNFFSRNILVIEDIKSDIRFAIDKSFRENDVEIPFPQRVLWHKNESENE